MTFSHDLTLATQEQRSVFYVPGRKLKSTVESAVKRQLPSLFYQPARFLLKHMILYTFKFGIQTVLESDQK